MSGFAKLPIATVDANTAQNAVSLTTGTPANITSISVPAGTWELSGSVSYLAGGSTTVTVLWSSISATSATQNATAGQRCDNAYNGAVLSGNNYTTQVITPFRVTLATTTTYYLVAQAGFAVSTMGAGGSIHAVPVP